MRPFGSPRQLKKRRRRAVALLKEWLSLHEVARRVGAHPSSDLRWRDALNEGGEAALRPKPASARHPCVSLISGEPLSWLPLPQPPILERVFRPTDAAKGKAYCLMM